MNVPTSLGHPHRKAISTQAALGRVLADLPRDAPELAALPRDPALLERRRRQAVAGGYRLTSHPAGEDQVTLAGVGALMPEVDEAARTLGEQGVTSGVVCLTSPDLVFRSL